LDLSLFQVDLDLTFAVFLLNSDRTIYGRFGTRSDLIESERDISLEALRAAMEAALELHRDYPANKAKVRAKTGLPPRVTTPSAYPWITENVKPSCIHCHQVGLSKRLEYRTMDQPLPAKLLYAWPMPDVVGLKLDPKKKATVRHVVASSPAERAGFQPGDEIRTFAGQTVLSIADVQWVLTNADEATSLKAGVRRAGQARTLTLQLKKGWRSKSDIAWRPSTWYLRSVLAGGLALEELSADERRAAGIGAGNLALRFHRSLSRRSKAYRAGFREGDVLTSLDGSIAHLSEAEFLANLLENKAPGDEIHVTVLRRGETMELKLAVD
jgi:predicted metalloprotease with PDZ domain